jgi:hypothetical protein
MLRGLRCGMHGILIVRFMGPSKESTFTKASGDESPNGQFLLL